jgi:hypothetical protein
MDGGLFAVGLLAKLLERVFTRPRAIRRLEDAAREFSVPIIGTSHGSKAGSSTVGSTAQVTHDRVSQIQLRAVLLSTRRREAKMGHEPHAYQVSSPSRAWHFSFAGHVAAEFAVGVALGVSAVVLGFNLGTLIAAIVLGIVITSSAVVIDVSGSRIRQHKSWDWVLVALLSAATVAAAIAAAWAATLVFGAAAAVEAGLLASTRYVPERR